MDPHELNLDEKFDYVLICNSLGRWHDIQKVLEHIHPLTKESTRIVITYYNYLWEWILRVGSFFRIRRPQPYQNWLPPADIAILLNLTNFDVIRTDSFLLMPKRIPPLTILCNYFLSLIPGYIGGGVPHWPCLAGTLYLFIDHRGLVSPCHELDPAGSIFDARIIRSLRRGDLGFQSEEARRGCSGCLLPCWTELSLTFSHLPSLLEAMEVNLRGSPLPHRGLP